MKKINTALIGLGARGHSLLDMLCEIPGMRIAAVCDVFEDRVKSAADLVAAKTSERPFETVDYNEILSKADIEAVIVATSWETHIKIAVDAMRAHKTVGLEVGGAYSLEECYELVAAQRESGARFMFLENCCYGRYELLVTNMVKQGLFGQLVHCEGGYRHDLRDEVLLGQENRHYRLRNYTNRNCENYPTHELGPISKLLDINNANSMVSLTSTASGSFGLNEYARTHDNIRPELQTQKFAQGDVVTTVIKCALGQTITLTLDTCLPRPYSRMFTVQGTRGMYAEDGNFFFLDGVHTDHFDQRPFWNNADTYFEKYEHPIWRVFLNDGLRGGHGGMDWLVYSAFADYAANGGQSPIDVYDAAAWMCITPLSQRSIEQNSAPVDIPDFRK